MAEQAQRDESKNLPADNEGSTPAAPPANASSMPQQPDLPAPPKSEPPLPQGGVSWEERRKGLPPEVVENPDEALYAERFASEQQEVNELNPAWKPIAGSPANAAPDWPPKPNSQQ